MRGFWENVRQFTHRQRCFFVLFVFVFVKSEISFRTIIPLFTPGLVHSGSVNKTEPNYENSWGCFETDKLLTTRNRRQDRQAALIVKVNTDCESGGATFRERDIPHG